MSFASETATRLQLVAWISYASGAIAAFGVVFLATMFASFAVGATSQALAVGRINDVLVMVSYLLAVPSAIALPALLRPHAQAPAGLTTAMGIGALAAIVVLQFLLVVGALTFEVQVGPVSVALLVLGAWFVVTGRLAGQSGALPRGGRMGLLAATYVGYPIWAFWFGRHLLRLSRRGVDTNAAAGTRPARAEGDGR